MPVISITGVPTLVATVTTTTSASGVVSRSTAQRQQNNLQFDKSWQTTPDYRVKRAKHALPMNSYFVKRSQTWRGYAWYKSVWSDGSKIQIEGIQFGEYNPNWFTSGFPSASAIAAVTARAKLKLLLEIKQQKVNLAQAYAERRRTAQMIGLTITRFVNSFRALRRGNVEDALRYLGAGPPSRRRRKRLNAILSRRVGPKPQGEFENAASLWLEIQYGWRPLLNDIYESAREIERALSRSPRKTGVRSTIRQPFNNQLFAAGSGTAKTDHSAKDTISVTATYHVWFTAPDVPRTLTQLGFTNPAYLAWELTPFSFVVDWFIPIGNALNAFDATVGLSFDKGCLSVKVDYYRRSMSVGRSGSGIVTTGEATQVEQIKQFQRTVLTSFPEVPVPQFKNPFSAEHVLNGLALLIQTFRPTGK